jgi:flagellar hook-associated protein 2
MSILPTSSSSSSSGGLQLSSLGSSTPLQITGLATGLDTNAIIQELMAIQQQPVIHLTNEQKGLQALNSNLQSIQSALQSVATNAQALADPTLFSPVQTVSSTNSALVSATAAANVGAVVGGYQINVTQLANPAQATFSFTSPTAADTVTVGSQHYSLASGATAQSLVNAVNSDWKGSAWATVTGSGTIVFSSRQTGAASSVSVSDTGGFLSQQSSQSGQDAQYTINGGSTQSSATNSVSGAIPGVNMTFNGITSSGPVTVTVGAPAPSASSAQSAVQNFVSSYNSVLSQIQTQLSQQPSSGDPTQGTLFSDPELQDLLTSMRQAMYSSGTGLPVGMATMMDIGISTGASTGGAAPSQSAIGGQLSIDTQTLTNAIQSNPNGVQSVLQDWSQSFAKLVDDMAGPGGSMDARIQGENTQISDLGNQITNLKAALADKQAQLTQTFANLEAALSKSQSTSSWLTSQLAAMPLP